MLKLIKIIFFFSKLIINKKIINHTAHNIDIKKISKNATFVIEQLKKHKFKAFIVGGAVRDLLLGLSPKDFDIATNALPEEVKKIFKKSRVIGRRFKIVNILFYVNNLINEVIEVTTFRKKINDKKHFTTKGRIISDNSFGSHKNDSS